MLRGVWLAGLLVAGCATRDLAWEVEFESSALERRAVAGRARILKDGCSGMDVEWEAELGEQAGEPDPPPTLGEGRYGFEVRVRDVHCDWYAAGCTEVELPAGDGSVTVTLGAIAPERGCPAGCAEGRCVSAPVRECPAGTLDCNGLAADGCEGEIDSLRTCGGCGMECGIADAFCAFQPNGTHECAVLCLAGTSCGSVCTDTSADPRHCGGCDRPCADRPGTRIFCLSGACTYECAPGRLDCNADPLDGCEAEGPCA